MPGKEEVIAKLREQVLQETFTKEASSRYGLFSVAPAGLSASATEINPLKKTLGADGKVITSPRGIYSGLNKSGSLASSFFSKVGYTSIDDPYMDPAKREKFLSKSPTNKSMRHDGQWKSPRMLVSDPTSPSYKHMTDYTPLKKNHRGPDGKVVTENRNIFTTGPHPGYGSSTVGHLFSKPAQHMPEPYNREREFNRKEREAGKKKEQDTPFISLNVKSGTFSTDKEAFGLTKPLPEVKPKPPMKSPKMHDTPFRPSNPTKAGCNDTIGKYPEHIADPPKGLTRKREDPGSKKDSFKMGNFGSPTRPTPSISLCKKNISREMSHFAAFH